MSDIRHTILTLQTHALRARPGPDVFGDSFTLRGERPWADEMPLTTAIDYMGETVDELERLIPTKSRGTALVLVNFLMVAAYAIGSIAKPSESQRKHFSALLSEKAGRAQGKKAAENARTGWQTDALATAARMRADNPTLSTRRLAVLIKSTLKRGQERDIDTIRKFLRSQEETGTLAKQS